MNNTVYTDKDVLPDNTYYYKIRAYDEVPNTATPSTESSGTPQDTVPPDQVTGLTISVVATGNSLALSWTASSAGDIAGYRIYRSTTSGGPYIHVTDQITNSYTDTGLTDGVTYYYLISAYDEVPNYGVNSTEKSGIPSDSTPPPKVTDVLITVVPTGNKLNIEWTDLSGTVSDLVGYKIYRSTTPGFTPGIGNYLTNTTNNYYNDTGLTDGITYYYRISAYDEVPNEGTASNQQSGTPQDTVAPDQVIGVQVFVKPEGNKLDISWNDVGGDVAGYKVYRNSTLSSWILLASTTNTYYNDTGLTDGLKYYYKISAYDEVPNYGINSTAVSGIPQDTAPPSQVTGLIVNVNNVGNKLDISWGDLGGDVVGYYLYRNTSSTQFILIANTSLNYYNDSGLTDGMTYYYKVSAYDEAKNEGQNSSIVSGIPVDNQPPAQITGLTISNPGVGNTLELSWTASSAPDIDHYNIYRSNIGVTGPFILINTTTTNSYTDINLIDGQTYYYKISGVDDGGPTQNEGLNSTVKSAIPSDTQAPPKVTGLKVIVVPSGNKLN